MASFITRAIRALVICVAFSFSGTAMAAYINANGVNCRVSPAAKARVVAKLSKGRSVSVKEGGGGWSRLVSPSCWVSSRLLSEDYVAQSSQRSADTYNTVGDSAVRSSRRQSSSNLYAFGSSTPKKTRKSAKRSKSRRSSGIGAYGSGGSCPCSGGSVCIGPRGGRYCITSGGNKRYGV
jgi:hypothetical protein